MADRHGPCSSFVFAQRHALPAALVLLVGCAKAPPPTVTPRVDLAAPGRSASQVLVEDDGAMPDAKPITLTLRRNETASAAGGVRVTLTAVMAYVEGGSLRDAHVQLALTHVSDGKSPDRKNVLVLENGSWATEGVERMTRTWCGLRFHLVDATADEQQATLRIEGHYALLPVQRIATGERKLLAPGTDVTFSGHSHKQTMQGDPESPLMVSLVQHHEAEDRNLGFNLHLSQTNVFEIGNQTWELVDYAYDAWMDLRLIGTP